MKDRSILSSQYYSVPQQEVNNKLGFLTGRTYCLAHALFVLNGNIINPCSVKDHILKNKPATES